MKTQVAVVIPNWNGEKYLPECIDSLLAQTTKCDIVVVENGSTDGSADLLRSNYKKVKVIQLDDNLGFAGGVNAGIRYSIENDYQYVALLNNDATADKNWLKHLLVSQEENPNVGIATCKLLKGDRKHIDSTGDLYTTWGLPYPRGRDELDKNQYDYSIEVFSASGGASLYRVDMLKEIGLFDEDFFAYYEDVDICFRAQLYGWKVHYAPSALAYHQIGGTSNKIKDFTTYQTLKNLPWVYWKNVPVSIAISMLPKIFTAYWSIFFSALTKGKFSAAIKGALMCYLYMFKKLFIERSKIQRDKKVSNEYIKSMITQGLPPNAHKLKKLRSLFVND